MTVDARPSSRLLTLVRGADVGGDEVAYDESAALLRAIARDAREVNALFRAIEASNDRDGLGRVLRRHTRRARDELRREIDRLADRDLSQLFWGQSLGVGALLVGGGGLVAATMPALGAILVVCAGAASFGVATRERILSNREKDRLRRGRDDLDVLLRDLDLVGSRT